MMGPYRADTRQRSSRAPTDWPLSSAARQPGMWAYNIQHTTDAHKKINHKTTSTPPIHVFHWKPSLILRASEIDAICASMKWGETAGALTQRAVLGGHIYTTVQIYTFMLPQSLWHSVFLPAEWRRSSHEQHTLVTAKQHHHRIGRSALVCECLHGR